MVPKTREAAAATRPVSRLVAVSGKPDPPTTADMGERPLRTGGGETARSVFRKLMEPPTPPQRREPGSTAAVLRGIMEPSKGK